MKYSKKLSRKCTKTDGLICTYGKKITGSLKLILNKVVPHVLYISLTPAMSSKLETAGLARENRAKKSKKQDMQSFIGTSIDDAMAKERASTDMKIAAVEVDYDAKYAAIRREMEAFDGVYEKVRVSVYLARNEKAGNITYSTQRTASCVQPNKPQSKQAACDARKDLQAILDDHHEARLTAMEATALGARAMALENRKRMETLEESIKKVTEENQKFKQESLNASRKMLEDKFDEVSKQQRATAKDVSGLIYGIGKVKLDLAEAKKKC